MVRNHACMGTIFFGSHCHDNRRNHGEGSHSVFTEIPVL